MSKVGNIVISGMAGVVIGYGFYRLKKQKEIGAAEAQNLVDDYDLHHQRTPLAKDDDIVGFGEYEFTDRKYYTLTKTLNSGETKIS